MFESILPSPYDISMRYLGCAGLRGCFDRLDGKIAEVLPFLEPVHTSVGIIPAVAAVQSVIYFRRGEVLEGSGLLLAAYYFSGFRKQQQVLPDLYFVDSRSPLADLHVINRPHKTRHERKRL
jgi:hypothetical protein